MIRSSIIKWRFHVDLQERPRFRPPQLPAILESTVIPALSQLKLERTGSTERFWWLSRTSTPRKYRTGSGWCFLQEMQMINHEADPSIMRTLCIFALLNPRSLTQFVVMNGLELCWILRVEITFARCERVLRASRWRYRW